MLIEWLYSSPQWIITVEFGVPPSEAAGYVYWAALTNWTQMRKLDLPRVDRENANQGSGGRGQGGGNERERPLGNHKRSQMCRQSRGIFTKFHMLPDMTLDRGSTIVHSAALYHPSPARNNAHMASAYALLTKTVYCWQEEEALDNGSKTISRLWYASDGSSPWWNRLLVLWTFF